MRKVIDRDPISGVEHVFYADDTTGEITITAEQEVASILEENKRDFVEAPERWGDLTRVGSIPMALYNKFQREGRLQDQPWLKRWLNNSENLYFRTRPGRV